MTTDNFRQVLFNDGEELTHSDLLDVQSTMFSRVMDQILGDLAPNIDPSLSTDPMFAGQLGVDPVQSPFAYCLSPGRAYLRQGSANHKIQIAPGTLIQKIAAEDGLTAKMVPFKFDGTSEFTLTNGDATNPRVDLLQISISYLDDTSISRVSETSAVKASFNFAAHTTHNDTVARAKVAGTGGNTISITLQKRSSGTGVSYSESGNTITILYQNSVSTVLDIETAITASSTLLEIQSAGTPGNVMVDPADTFSSLHLTGGVDSLIILNSINKRRRSQCTLSVKAGTPAASPTIPDPDSGCVIVGTVVVGNGWTTGGNAPIFGLDTAAANNLVIHDQRMPLVVREFWVPLSSANLFSNWSYSSSVGTLTSTNATNDLRFMCPIGLGRLVGVAFDHQPPDDASPTAQPKLAQSSTGSAEGTPSSRAQLNFTDATPVGTRSFACVPARSLSGGGFDGSPVPSAGPTIVQSATTKIGVPVWTNGRRSPHEAFQAVGLGNPSLVTDRAYLRFQTGFSGTVIRAVVFFVAIGI